MASALEDAARELITIVNKKHPDYEDTVRLKAIELLFLRVLGKPKEHVQVDVTAEVKPWFKMVAEAIISKEDDPIEEPEEGEVVETRAWYEDEFADETVDIGEDTERSRLPT